MTTNWAALAEGRRIAALGPRSPELLPAFTAAVAEVMAADGWAMGSRPAGWERGVYYGGTSCIDVDHWVSTSLIRSRYSPGYSEPRVDGFAAEWLARIERSTHRAMNAERRRLQALVGA